MCDKRKEDIAFVLCVFFATVIACLVGLFFMSCCPKPPISHTVVEVERPCPLPPGPGKLPVPEKLDCLSTSDQAKLAARDNKLKQWIRETKTRCAAPDAGVPDVHD